MSFYWLHPNTEAYSSPIHGKGRRATAKIEKESPICVVGGIACSKKEVPWKTGLLIDEDFILQLPEGSGYEAFLNHSCEPNLYIDGQVVFRALEDLSPGQELTVDYGTFMVVDRTVIENCNCQSSLCRQRIEGDDYKRVDKPLSWLAQKKLNMDRS